MTDAADVVGRLIFGSLIAVYVAHGYAASKARARNAAGIGHLSCGQCGEALPSLPIKGSFVCAQPVCGALDETTWRVRGSSVD